MGRSQWLSWTSCRSYGRLEVKKLLVAGCVLMIVAVAAAGCRVVSPPQVDAKVFLVRTSSPEVEVVAVPRRVSAEIPLAEAVLRELLKGPTTAERGQGLASLIPKGPHSGPFLSPRWALHGPISVRGSNRGSAVPCGSWASDSRSRRHSWRFRASHRLYYLLKARRRGFCSPEAKQDVRRISAVSAPDRRR